MSVAPLTNVPGIQITLTGIVLPDESAILAGTLTDIDTAFGGGTNIEDLETPQGQIASSTAAVVGDKNDQFLALANNFDPAFAAGRFQDAIGRIYFQTRNPGTPTAVAVLCTGLENTPIPVGATVRSIVDGTIFGCTQAGTIPVGGSITLTFAALTFGPIALPANSLKIYQAIPGWESAVNAGAGTPGSLVESRNDFEFRRKNSVAIGGKNSIQSIFAAVFALPNVIDAVAVQNDASTSTIINGVSVVANGIYVAVVGGAAADIANAIWIKKPPGCNMTGDNTLVVSDASYDAPQPEYTMRWATPTPTAIFFAVSIVNAPGLPSNIVTLIQNAIAAAFFGADGGPRARTGGTIYAFRFTGPINGAAPLIQILSVAIGTAADPTGASLSLTLAENPTITAADIAVTLV